MTSVKSVNWTIGMLLTPEHFLAQDGFVESVATWSLRHLVNVSGLVGGGARAGSTGLERFDPMVRELDDGKNISVTVSSARGITISGDIVEIAPEDAVSREIAGESVRDRTELYVVVIHTGEREADPNTLNADDANRGQAAQRRPKYDVTLLPSADDAANALVVARLRRADNNRFVRDPDFIPPCATALGHSAMAIEWRRLRDATAGLAESYADLHRRAATYIALLEGARGPAPVDRDLLGFIERVALACDTCAYELLDPTASPTRLFRQIDLAGRRAAIALDLLGQAREFLRLAPDVDPALGSFLDEERNALRAETDTSPLRDVRVSITRALTTLSRIGRLLQITHEKYEDYRDSRVLLRLPYLLDEQNRQVFEEKKKVMFAAEGGALRRFSFPDLAPARPGQYRVALIGKPDAISEWTEGDKLAVNVLVTPAAGTPRNVPLQVKCERPDQRNFALDIDAATAANMMSIRVEVTGRVESFEHAVLYRLYDGDDEPVIATQEAAKPQDKPPSKQRKFEVQI